MTAAAIDDMDLGALFRGVAPAEGGEVTDITADSREAVAGGVFLACAGGARHGLEFVDEAIRAGVGAVAFEPAAGIGSPHLPAGVTAIPVPALRDRLGEIADRFFGSPSASLPVVGITGTNGKTTTAWLVMQALERLGRRSGYIGTLGRGLGGDIRPGHLTTPDCVTVHRHLRELADGGARAVLTEVSSHALDQGRVDGVRFRIVAFSNLSHEHLDYHGDLEAYGAAKARLFTATTPEAAVINLDDAFGRALCARLPAATHRLGVSFASGAANDPEVALAGTLVAQSPDGLTLDLHEQGRTVRLRSALWGRFNADNLLLAAGILRAMDFGLDAVADTLGAAGAPPGRMERVVVEGIARPAVVVDFAHTPDALGKALGTMREHGADRLWCVFGCGGNRDAGKRGPMGLAAARLADRVILTDDNPRDEDPRQIVRDILGGIPDSLASAPRVQVIHDRAAAIAHAIRSAAPGDAVLVAGKGHEQVQIAGDVRRPFSDVAVAGAALAARASDPGKGAS